MHSTGYYAPAIWATQVHEEAGALTGLLCFDDTIIARFRVSSDRVEDERDLWFREGPEQTHEELHRSVDLALDLLARVHEWYRIDEENQSAGADPAHVLYHLASEATCGKKAKYNFIIHCLEHDVPPAPYYVYADDAESYFGNLAGEYQLRLIVPCESVAQAQHVEEQLRRIATQPPMDYERALYRNIRVSQQRPIADPGILYALIPTGPRSWLWDAYEEVIPPDNTLFAPIIVDTTTVVLGEFDVPDGRLIVRDPAYDDDLPFTTQSVIDVLPGRYQAVVTIALLAGHGQQAIHDTGITVRHVDFPDTPFAYDERCVNVNVDSGRVAVFSARGLPHPYGSHAFLELIDKAGFDYHRYGSDAFLDLSDKASFDYHRSRNDGDKHTWVIEEAGVCVYSGYGDGCYVGSPARIGQHIVGLILPFITDAIENYPSDPYDVELPAKWNTAVGQARMFANSMRKHPWLHLPDRSVLDVLEKVARKVEQRKKIDEGQRAHLLTVAKQWQRLLSVPARRAAVVICDLLATGAVSPDD